MYKWNLLSLQQVKTNAKVKHNAFIYFQEGENILRHINCKNININDKL